MKYNPHATQITELSFHSFQLGTSYIMSLNQLYDLFVLTVDEAYKLQFASSINKKIIICRTTSEREIGEKVYYIILTTKKFSFSRKNRVGYSLLQPMPAAATAIRYIVKRMYSFIFIININA